MIVTINIVLTLNIIVSLILHLEFPIWIYEDTKDIHAYQKKELTLNIVLTLNIIITVNIIETIISLNIK